MPGLQVRPGSKRSLSRRESASSPGRHRRPRVDPARAPRARRASCTAAGRARAQRARGLFRPPGGRATTFRGRPAHRPGARGISGAQDALEVAGQRADPHDDAGLRTLAGALLGPDGVVVLDDPRLEAVPVAQQRGGVAACSAAAEPP